MSAPIRELESRLDYDDYAAIPADGKTYELLDGEVQVTPVPGPPHQRYGKRLQRELERHFEDTGRGEVFNAPIDLILSFHDVVQPDLVVVTEPELITRRAIEGVPVLVVEVLSPSNRTYDLQTKAQRYASLGVPHYWIVDPDAHSIACFALDGGRFREIVTQVGAGTLEHPSFPGLAIDTGRVWR